MNKKIYNKARIIETLFYVSIIAIPLINFIFLQFYQNYVDVFIFSFKVWDFDTSSFHFNVNDPFLHYRNAIVEIVNNDLWAYAFRNALISTFIGYLFMPLYFIVPLYIVKKYFGHRFIKFIMLMPGMIAAMVWTLLFTMLVDRGIPQLFNLKIGLLANKETAFWTICARGVWFGFGSAVLMYTGLFSGIDQSVIEAGEIDGLSFWGQWAHIYMPLTYPVWSLSFVNFFVGLFSGGSGLIEYFGYTAGKEVTNPGYILFVKVMANSDMYGGFGFNCAASIMFTLVALPLTMFLKWAFERFGPSEDEPRSKKDNSFKRTYNDNFGR